MLILKNICLGFFIILLILTAHIMDAGFAVVDISAPEDRRNKLQFQYLDPGGRP